MDKHPPTEEDSIVQVLRRLNELEMRISRLENKAEVPHESVFEQLKEDIKSESIIEDSESEGIESKVGEYGMAWLGNIVLLFGIIFMIQFFKSQEHILFSSLFGYASVAGVYLIARLIRIPYPYMSNLFTYNGHLLLFIVTLRLHFGTPVALIGNMYTGLFFLLMVIGWLMYTSYHNKSQVLTGIVLIMIFITAIYSNSTPVMLSLMILTAAYSVFLVQKSGWWNILIMSEFIVYSIFLNWTFNNPFITNTLKTLETLQYGYIYLLACAIIYSMLALLPVRDKIREQPLNISIILNGLGFSFIIAIILVVFFKDNYYIPLGLISGFSLAYSALLKSRGVWKLSAALYALYGFVILSITISGIYKFPLAFLLLSIQSLLVVSMALWFRSRFIVLMNVVLFIGLLIAYCVFPKPISSIDFAFTLVAFITARIVNWKKDRLNIKTEMIRNAYLIIGFIMSLISLYRAVPGHYVTLSWTMAAGIFFIMSMVLKNVKYRWLAISTMIVTAFYFFMFDLRQVSIGYRIIALLFLAIISLSFSTFYARRMKKKKAINTNNNELTSE